MCDVCVDADVVGRQSDDIMSSLLNSSEHQSVQCADVVTNSVRDDETLTKLHQLEASDAQLVQQLAAMSATLRLRTLGFEALTVLVRYLMDEVDVGCVFSVLLVFTL